MPALCASRAVSLLVDEDDGLKSLAMFVEDRGGSR